MKRLLVALAVAVVVAPLVALGQPREMRTVGVLTAGSGNTAIAVESRRALERGLAGAGWTPDRNLRLEYRYADGDERQMLEQARELVALPADVIIARTSAAIRVAKQVTTTVPIVMSASGLDPIELGFVASLARPGGNVTGLTLLAQNLLVKQLELLRETVPRLTRVGVLGSTGARLPPGGRQELDAAAKAVGVQLLYVDVHGSRDIDSVFENLVRSRVDGLLVRADPISSRRTTGASSPWPSGTGCRRCTGFTRTPKPAASCPTGRICSACTSARRRSSTGSCAARGRATCRSRSPPSSTSSSTSRPPAPWG